MDNSDLIEMGRRVISDRVEHDFEGFLSNDYFEGFQEGVAEMIAYITGESAADMLELLTGNECEICGKIAKLYHYNGANCCDRCYSWANKYVKTGVVND